MKPQLINLARRGLAVACTALLGCSSHNTPDLDAEFASAISESQQRLAEYIAASDERHAADEALLEALKSYRLECERFNASARNLIEMIEAKTNLPNKPGERPETRSEDA